MFPSAMSKLNASDPRLLKTEDEVGGNHENKKIH